MSEGGAGIKPGEAREGTSLMGVKEATGSGKQGEMGGGRVVRGFAGLV